MRPFRSFFSVLSSVFPVANLRLTVYEHILSTGRVPLVATLASRLSIASEEISTELQRLQGIHAFALAPGSDEILMAHPFSAVPTSHEVRTPAHSFWANCAWDAVAIPPLLGGDATVHTRCPDCADAMVFRFSDGVLEPAPGVVHFVVPPRDFWRNVVFT